MVTNLELVHLSKPEVSNGKVLVRMTAAGVTPLEHTILFEQYPKAKAPLVLGGEGAGVVEKEGGAEFPAGSRVMFTGPYGVSEDGTYSEWVAARKQDLCPIPEGVDDVNAAGIPVAYLAAQMALSLADFQAGKTVLAPAIGGSVGNALARLGTPEEIAKAVVFLASATAATSQGRSCSWTVVSHRFRKTGATRFNRHAAQGAALCSKGL